MKFSLPKNFIRQDFWLLTRCMTNNCGGGVVATTFNAEDRESLCQGLGLLCGALPTGNTFAMVPTIPPTVLLTRPLAASRRFAKLLDVRVVISPLMETLWLAPRVLPDVPDVVVFTSENGVLGFKRCQKWRGRALCVGDRTAQAAQDAGFDAVSAGGDLEDLKKLLDLESDGAQLVHARGRYVAGDVGPNVRVLIVYEQSPLPLTDEACKALNGTSKVIVPLFSPRSATRFAEQLPRGKTAPIAVVAMSAAVGDAARIGGLEVALVADAPDGPAMIRAIRFALG